MNFTFIPKKDDLNSTRESLVPTVGDVKWNIPDLIRHKTTKQYNQMLHDKYGYTKEAGSDDKIPLAFYFDLSPSMAEYSRFLALISLKILKKNVRVLIGANETVQIQINSISQTTTLEDLKHILESPYCIDRKGVEVEQVGRNLDEYLREKGAKRVAVFSDFDPKEAIENLSEFAEIYWFCFEERENSANTSLSNFKGRFYKTRNIEDFVEHLKNIKSRYYEHLQRAQMEGGQERDD